MPHGQPSSLRRQKAGRHQAADTAANDGHRLADERARWCHGVDDRLFRRRATLWRRAAAWLLRARARSARGRFSFRARSFGPRGTETEW
eukprot:1656656-Prymnesium_polylepis.1